jgi:arsenate reductase (thioredoxin)
MVVQILADLKKYDEVQPLFICTHNSRRSHMAQLWLNTAAGFYGIDGIRPYSGGTETTAFNKNAVAALQRSGFSFTEMEHEGQKVYIATTRGGSIERLMFSKKFDDKVNPKKNFFAVMVCSEADESCPIVPGADNRISLPYDDPRYFDGTPSVDVKYDETSRLIAREMFYVMAGVKKQLNLEAETKK